jgi:hypothetical protein
LKALIDAIDQSIAKYENSFKMEYIPIPYAVQILKELRGLKQLAIAEQNRIIKELRQHANGPDDYGYHTVEIEDAVAVVKGEICP